MWLGCPNHGMKCAYSVVVAPAYNSERVASLLVLLAAAFPLVCAANESGALVLFALSWLNVAVGWKMKVCALAVVETAKLASKRKERARGNNMDST
jgi:hypothetical protein